MARQKNPPFKQRGKPLVLIKFILIKKIVSLNMLHMLENTWHTKTILTMRSKVTPSATDSHDIYGTNNMTPPLSCIQCKHNTWTSSSWMIFIRAIALSSSVLLLALVILTPCSFYNMSFRNIYNPCRSLKFMGPSRGLRQLHSSWSSWAPLGVFNN